MGRIRFKWIKKICFFSGISFLLICFAVGAGASTENSAGQRQLKSAYTLVESKSLFTLKAYDADVRTILQDVSKQTGIPIIISPDFSSTITADLCDVSFETLIKKLTKNWGIVYTETTDNGTRRQRIQKVTVAETQPKNEENHIPEAPPSLPSGINLQAPPVIRPDQPNSARSIENNQPDPVREDTGFRADELAVKFDTKLSREQIQSIVNQAGLSVKQHIAAINYYILSVAPYQSVEKVQQQLQKLPGVAVAEPNCFIPVQWIPDDAYFEQQWALHNTGQTGGIADADMDVPEAWDLGPAPETITIAVIDTGVDYTHEDLAANIWNNLNEIPDNGIDDDANGYIDDHMGWDFVDTAGASASEVVGRICADDPKYGIVVEAIGASDEDLVLPDNDPMDRQGHGTLVSGIIGAVSNNGIGISGIAPDCRIMPVRAGYKTASGDGVFESVDAANAIIYAADNGASILNLSWGDGFPSSIIADALAYAASNGLLICAAAGNESTSDFLYPAALENEAIIAVGATDSLDEKAGYSNYGTWVDVSAPGTSIYTTELNNSYGYASGTSMATPYVAGMAAMIMGHYPDLSISGVKSQILLSVDYLLSLEGLNATAGRINAYSALTANFIEPYIFSISPAQAHTGEQIIISGDRFGESQLVGTVVFAPAITGAVVAWSNNEIVCTVPENAQTGTIRVDIGSGHVSNAIDFTVLTRFYNESLTDQAFIGAGTAQGWQADDQAWQYTLPFEFPFYGQTYQTVYVCSNGYLDFTDAGAASQNSVENLKNRVMIAPLWSDLMTSGSSQLNEDIYIHSPAVGLLCIRWAGEAYDTGNSVNSEVVLHQDGTIECHYGIGNAAMMPTIGISAGTGEAMLVAAHDGAADLNQAQTLVLEPIETINVSTPFSISLNPGWNLVSLPVLPENTDIANILADIMRNLDSIWGFKDGNWVFYSPAYPQFSELATMEPGHGYWVQADQAGLSIEIEGPVSEDTLNVTSGWNLLGWSILQQPVPVPDALTEINRPVVSVWAYNHGQWQVFDTQNSGLSDLQEIEPGVGYWVLVE